jgi:hypothetical protein
VENKALTDGLAVLAAGLLASGLSSFLAHFTILGTAADFIRGVFDGLSVVAFGVAIVLLVRSRRGTQG